MSGLAYNPDAHTISGTLVVKANQPSTLMFAVQVRVMGTAGFAPEIVNRACIYPPDAGLAACEWSNRVVHYTYVWPIYLPLVRR